ncbi:hypothetical protein ABLG96_08810 [Nakamurella sp. A5-74]|uniref:Uncharacterized protein n=1 Tax=Nakamurella sp. A5-74 TaxID=3158264 RepID=A0AAU8DV84_9ACTN
MGETGFWIRVQQVSQLAGALCGLAFIIFVGDTLGIVLGSLLFVVNVVGLVATTRRAAATRAGESS